MPKRFISENIKISNNKIEIYGDEAKHIMVTRNNINDEIEINEFICKITKIDKGMVECEIIKNADKKGIPNIKVTLYQALLKSDKMEYVIQKAVELGTTEIIPFKSKNVVVKLDDKDSTKKVQRWNKIAIEAVKQCGRSDTATVCDILNFNDMIDSLKKYDKVILAYENEKTQLKSVMKNLSIKDNIAIIIGSEGGFDISEVEKILTNENVISVSLGSRILRAETASLNLLSILMYELEY